MTHPRAIDRQWDAPAGQSMEGTLPRMIDIPPVPVEVVAGSVKEGGLTFASVASLTARQFGRGGALLGESTRLVEYRLEDVVGLMLWTFRDGKVFVWLCDQLRPALFAREEFGLPPIPSARGGRMVLELGGYVSGTGLREAGEQVLARKATGVPYRRMERLGGTIVPHGAVSPEVDIPLIVEVPPDFPLEAIRLTGDNFEADRVLFPVELRTAVERTFRGEYGDPRMFESLCRLAGRLTRRGIIPPGLVSAPPDIEKAVNERLNSLSIDEPNDLKVLSAREARELILNPHLTSDLPLSMEIDVVDGSVAGGPFRTRHFEVRRADHEPFGVDAVVRTSDLLNMTAVTVSDGEPVMLVNIGTREALAARDYNPHLLPTTTEARSLEGITGDLMGPLRSSEVMTRDAQRLLRSLNGLELDGPVIPSGIHGVLSPGVNTSVFWHCFGFVDPKVAACHELPPRWFWMRPADVLTLAMQGVVRDLSLLTSVRALTLTQPEDRSAFHLGIPIEIAEKLDERSLRESAQMLFVRTASPELHSFVISDRIFSRIMFSRINLGGVRIERPSTGHQERLFFNSLMQGFVVHEADHPLRVQKLFVHDCCHWGDPDPLPFEMKEGRLVAIAPERYAQAVIDREVNAVVISECCLPERFNTERFEALLGSATLASLMARAEITRINDQREVVMQAIGHGVLDQRLLIALKDPEQWGKYRSAVREVLIGYYVRDTLKNVGILYDYWTSNPELAAVAQRMNARLITDAEADRATLEERLRRIVHGENGKFTATGYNPLQESLSYTITYDLFEPALRLTGIARMIREHCGEPQSAACVAACERISRMVDELVLGYHSLSKKRDAIQGIEIDPASVAADEEQHRLENTTIRQARELMSAIEFDTVLLNARQRQELASRQHFPFPLLAFDPREDSQSQKLVTANLTREFAKIGVDFAELERAADAIAA